MPGTMFTWIRLIAVREIFAVRKSISKCVELLELATRIIELSNIFSACPYCEVISQLYGFHLLDWSTMIM